MNSKKQFNKDFKEYYLLELDDPKFEDYLDINIIIGLTNIKPIDIDIDISNISNHKAII